MSIERVARDIRDDSDEYLTWELIPDVRIDDGSDRVAGRVDAQLVMSNSCLLVGSLGIGSVFSGLLPSGHELIPILAITGAGMFLLAIWYGVSRDYLSAWIFGGFAGFNTTWMLVQLGIWHSWYGIAQRNIPNMMTAYMSIWMLLFLAPVLPAFRVSRGLAAILGCVVIGIGLDIGAYQSDASATFLRLVSVPAFLIAAISLWRVVGGVMRWQRRLSAFRGQNVWLSSDRASHRSVSTEIVPRSPLETDGSGVRSRAGSDGRSDPQPL